MKVTGFSFIKNAIIFQYPVAEALTSILPLCDEVIVAVGDSDDDTRALISSIAPGKIKIIDSVWDDNLREGGQVLAAETNKAFQAVAKDSDWCFYIQGDEVVHEDGYSEIKEAMHRWKDDKKVDGLLFNYRHFYGSFDYVGTSSRWYRKEIRIVRNDKNIYSYRDAQGFRKGVNEKLWVKPLHAFIHHYGWVRPPEAMYSKSEDFSRHWSGGTHEGPRKIATGIFNYNRFTDSLKKFTGNHPKIIQPGIDKMNWAFEYDISHNKLKPKERFKNLVERLTGKRPFDFNNYKII